MMVRTLKFVSNRTIFKIGKTVSPSSMQSNNLYMPFIIKISRFFMPRMQQESFSTRKEVVAFTSILSASFSLKGWVGHDHVLTDVIMAELVIPCV